MVVGACVVTEEHHVFHVSGTCALGFTLKEEGREGDRGKEEERK